MSMMLFNPTNESFDMMYAGRGIVLDPGEKLKVEDAAGRHLLNAFAPRGLCALEFGDDEAIASEGGRERNLEFKKRMVMNHNQGNVARKQQGLSYRTPIKVVREYAKELGLTLDEPYAVRDKEHDRLAVLENTVDNLTKMMTRFLEKSMSDEEAPAKKGGGKKEKANDV
jgi:hypothetical protein